MDVEPATSATSTETIRRSPAVTDTGELYAAHWALVGDAASAAGEYREERTSTNGRRGRLMLGEAARIIREAVKDKSSRKTPLGQLVGRYLRWFRNEYGATESTIRDYEAILARMSLLLADREPLEVSTEDLREVIDTWGMRHAPTRAKVTSVIRAFWIWAEEEGHVPFSPASKIRRPRAPRKTAPLLPTHVDELLLGCARAARDRLALLVLLDCGVRRGELAGIRIPARTDRYGARNALPPNCVPAVRTHSCSDTRTGAVATSPTRS
jgi:integrase